MVKILNVQVKIKIEFDETKISIEDAIDDVSCNMDYDFRHTFIKNTEIISVE